MENEIEALKLRTVVALTNLTNQVKKAPSAKSSSHEIAFVELSSMTKTDIQPVISEKFGGKNRSLYYIRLNDQADCVDVWEALTHARDENVDKRSYSRVHDFMPSPYLYVGSSKSLTTRLLGHLGFGAKTTYSLHLSTWASELNGGFVIQAFVFSEVTQEVLCAMEDQLSADLKPLFGRRGSV